MSIRHIANSILPTRFGEFEIHAFIDENNKEHVALVKNSGEQAPAVRIHSKCFTGDTLASMRCDCRDQLEASLEYISKHGGIFIYLDQEGRGIGLTNKIKAYALQDAGLDTVEANYNLGFEDDLREYKIAADILSYLGAKKIKLLTNNPKKMKNLEMNGIEVIGRIPVSIKPNKFNKVYMETKKEKLEHLIETDD